MTPKEEERPTSLRTSTRSVVVVRHGERLDYVMRDAGQNWIPTTDRPWDPPLTEHGHPQAKALGAKLPGILKDLRLPCIAAIYSSPFWRCRQTAVGLGNKTDSLKVRVELGLAESMNENWFRSWAAPGTDGSWGYQKQEKPLADLDPSALHPAATEPVQKILDWKLADKDEAIHAHIDSDFVSKTSIDTPYSMHPSNFESMKMQRSRMKDTLELLSTDHPNETIVLVSHGKLHDNELLMGLS
jgi:broad specificity phosphatase PhoE